MDRQPSGVEAARLRDNAQRTAVATLADPHLSLTDGEIVALVTDFRRTRDGLRGRFAADVRDLPAPGVRIATAIVRASNGTRERSEIRALAEDLVDLQAFVDLEGRSGPKPPERGQPPSPVLELVRWRQAAAVHFIREDPSVVGDKVAQGDHWTPIGAARAALDRAGSYRDDQAAGFLAILVFIVAGTAGVLAALATVAPRMTATAALALFVIWWFSGWLGARVIRAVERLWATIVRSRWPATSDSMFIATFMVLLAAVEFVIAFTVVAVGAHLPVP